MNKITITEIQKRKREGRKITMLTAYDFPFAQIVDEAGIDMILIGDSLGVVVQGNDSTLSVTMDEMLYHTRIVSRAVEHALVVGDMPFMSFQPGVEDAVRNACRFLQAGASAVKLEGGGAVADRIRALARMDIPVMGHIGLTPQSIHRMGGYKVQGREPEMAGRILADAKAVEEAGAFAVVLEGIPMELGRKITKALSIPTIGIGGGPHCDGQVLVLHDLLGLFDRFHPTFVKTYANLKSQALDAIKRYKEEVETGKFPSEKESYK
ncbi:MAG: 3-methyl-2-oxobutanoate hydroxymethyltransferase [Nitrospirae bacterium]|nr:3-methyl-2-oxobutanoate hydroxymethyltransferase [Nitrospirota bacterium]